MKKIHSVLLLATLTMSLVSAVNLNLVSQDTTDQGCGFEGSFCDTSMGYFCCDELRGDEVLTCDDPTNSATGFPSYTC